ncbi:MAG: PorT family protein [Flavisolibacter sp.]|nr:PorT family protein [Flavisolibacter sp.]
MAVAGFLATGVTAQTISTTPAGGLGIRAGVNFQNINGKDMSGNDLKNDMMTGFHAGLTADLPLGPSFVLQPGVLYSLKGAEIMNDTKIKLSYIEVPLNFIYKPALGTGSLLLGAGPYVAFGINGKMDGPGSNSTDVEFTSDFDANNTAPQFKRFDAGANLLAGYEFLNKLSFQINAQLGLAEINPTMPGNDQSKWKNTGFGLSLGYKF